MKKICQYCIKEYEIRDSRALGSKFCSRYCHDKGKVYKRHAGKKELAIKLRLEKRLAVSDISKELGLPYKTTATYVQKYPLTKEEQDKLRNDKLQRWHDSVWPVGNKALRRRLGENKCSVTGCEWTQTLELHHINGDSFDNRKENLQVLCPNHHSITPNFRNRKRLI